MRFTQTRLYESGEPRDRKTIKRWFGGGRLETQVMLCAGRLPNWMIAEQETGELAEQLIAATCDKQGIAPGQLTLHADRGAPMVAKTVAQLLIDLGIAKTHSRPYTSNDNPYSEAQFKTLKYRPDYPDRFASPAAARVWASFFFDWYNNAHYHTGLNLMTPATVHYRQVEAVCEQRNQVLQVAYALHPERFVQGLPQA
jgi:putative transposase